MNNKIQFHTPNKSRAQIKVEAAAAKTAPVWLRLYYLQRGEMLSFSCFAR